MFRREDKQVWQYGFGVLALVAGLLLVFFSSWTFADFEQVFEVFRSERKLLRNPHAYGFSEATYQVTKGFLFVLATGSLLLVQLLNRSQTSNSKPILFPVKTLRFFGEKLSRQWQVFPRWEKWLLVFLGLVLLVVKLFLLQVFPEGLDEISTYILFLDKGLPGVLTYYPLPNNHILYSLLCLPLSYVFSDPFWTLKLPGLLISMVTLPVMYLGLRSVFRFPIALLVTAGSNFAYLALYYSVNGRGYFILLLCTVLQMLAILKLVQQKGNTYWLVFLLAGIAGFYAVPVFLYPTVAMFIFGGCCFLSKRDLEGFRQLVVTGFFMLAATALLYLPVILVSGADQLFANPYVDRLPLNKIFNHLGTYFFYTQGAILGQETIGAFVWLAGVLLLTSLLLFRKKFKTVFSFMGLKPLLLFWVLCGAVLPWGLLVIHGVLPPDRVWIFKIFPDFMVLGITISVISYFGFRYKQKLVVVVLAVLLLSYAAYQTHKLYRSTQVDSILSPTFVEMRQEILQRGTHQIVASEGFYAYFLLYDLLRLDIDPFVLDINHPVPGRTYDTVIVDRAKDFRPEVDYTLYRLHYQNSWVQIYFRK